MENPTQFDLNHAIRQWRSNLESSPAFLSKDLDELEMHLHDAVLALEVQGLGVQDAFTIARRRLGDRAALEQEFGKGNLREIWRNRCLWMLIGLLLCFFMQRLTLTPLMVVMDAALASQFSAAMLGVLLPFGMWILILGGMLGVLFLCQRNKARVGRLVQWAVRWWWLSGPLLLLVLYYSFSWALFLGNLLTSLLGQTIYSSPPSVEGKMAMVKTFIHWTGPLGQLLWILLAAGLAAYLQKLRRTEAGSASQMDALSIPPNQRHLVEHFQSQGLTVDEACFLALSRENPVSPDSAMATPRLLWADHVLWMSVGVILNMVLFNFVFQPAWILPALNQKLISQAPLYGHLFGALSLAFASVLAVLFFFLFWRFVTRPHRFKDWFTTFFTTHPARATLSLALLYFALERGFWVLGTLVFRVTRPGMGLITSKWFEWQYVLFQMAIPIALLLFLAHSRQRHRPKITL